MCYPGGCQRPHPPAGKVSGCTAVQPGKKQYPAYPGGTEITAIRGTGLLVALTFNSDIAEDMVLACLEKGLLVNKVKPNALRFMPPLVITEEDIDEGLKIIEEVLARRL